jgi:ubiquitin-like domain-containing CTD phosphatase 1
MGQLILRGYDQEMVNGQHLRDAYIYDEGSMAHDPKMRLIDISGTDKLKLYAWSDHNMYYRVDDDQHHHVGTEYTDAGHVGAEITQFFQSHQHYPVIPLHTADRENDIIDPNERKCPRLTEMRERYERSNQYRSFNQSAEAVQLRSFMKNVLKIDGDMEATDCLMTTMCTDRGLPDAQHTGDGDGTTGGDNCMATSDGHSHDDERRYSSSSFIRQNLFQRLYDFEASRSML